MSSSSHQGSKLEQYKKVGSQISLESTSPHRLIQMLMEGALEKINLAKGYMQRGDVALKGSHISWAISIIDGLRMSLDSGSSDEIAQNLYDLYEYMARRLAKANMENNIEILDEVSGLLIEIKSAWDAVPELVQQQNEHESAL